MNNTNKDGENPFRLPRKKANARGHSGFIGKEKIKEKGNKVYIEFIGLEKASDNVEWVKLLHIKKNIGINYRDKTVIYHLHREQRAMLQLEREMKEVNIIKGLG